MLEQPLRDRKLGRAFENRIGIQDQAMRHDPGRDSLFIVGRCELRTTQTCVDARSTQQRERSTRRKPQPHMRMRA